MTLALASRKLLRCLHSRWVGKFLEVTRNAFKTPRAGRSSAFTPARTLRVYAACMVHHTKFVRCPGPASLTRQPCNVLFSSLQVLTHALLSELSATFRNDMRERYRKDKLAVCWCVDVSSRSPYPPNLAFFRSSEGAGRHHLWDISTLLLSAFSLGLLAPCSLNSAVIQRKRKLADWATKQNNGSYCEALTKLWGESLSRYQSARSCKHRLYRNW